MRSTTNHVHVLQEILDGTPKDTLHEDHRAALCEAIRSLAQQGEAVAWMLPMTIRNGVPSHIPDFATERAYVERHRQREDWIPLFTHPAAVDETMLERAKGACVTNGAYFPPETDDEWREVLTAALQPATSEGESNG